jgi:hypothetical protein
MTIPQPTTSPWLAWPALIFGAFGILLCLAALIATFIVSSHLRTSVDNVFERVSSLLSTVHETSTEVTATIASSRRTVTDIDQRIDEEITLLADKTNIDPAQLESLTTQLSGITQRLRDWLTLFDSAQQFSRLVEELIDATLGFFQSDNEIRQDILTTLENGQVQLEETIIAFDELMIQWENLRNDPETPSPVKPLFTRIDESLALVEKYTATFTTGIAELENATEDLQSRLKQRIFFGTFIISLLLVWQAVAQFCLARWGWHKRRPSALPGETGQFPA